MTDAAWYRVKGTNFHLKIDTAGEITDAMQLRSRRGRAKPIRLRMTTQGQRFEPDTFRIGARGLATVIGAIGASLKPASGKKVMDRLRALFPGEPLFTEMLAGTVRAALDAPASGEGAYFRDIARDQLSARPFHPVEIKARLLKDGVPVEMLQSDA